MSVNTIKEWLNGSRGYTEGLALYEGYGQNARLLAALRQGHSPYRQEKMEAALRELLQLAERPAAAPAAPVASQVRVAEAPMPETAVAEKEDPYREKWLPLYIEMNALRHTLPVAANDQERGDMAHKILSLERQCMMWWARRDYYLRNGSEMPEETKASDTVTDKNALHRSLTNVRTYLTKAKKECEQADTEAKREAATKRFTKYSEQLAELTKQLKHG